MLALVSLCRDFVSLSPLLQAYGVKRLARGLASSRQGARQGFAAAFAATLAHSAAGASTPAGQQAQLVLQRPFVSAAGVLAVLDACLEVTGSMKGTVCWSCLNLFGPEGPL